MRNLEWTNQNVIILLKNSLLLQTTKNTHKNVQ